MKWQSTVRLRVINVLKHWVSDFIYDFEADNELMQRLTAYVERLRVDNPQWYLRILQTVQEKGAPQFVGRLLNPASPIEAIAAAMKRPDGGLGACFYYTTAAL